MRWRDPSSVLGWTLALGLAAGCRTADHRAQSPVLSERAVVLAVPVLLQDDLYECGLATVSALCQYHQLSLPEEIHAELVGIASSKAGLSGSELRAALEALGLEVYIFAGRLDGSVAGIFHHIDRGRPVLVMLSENGSDHHYCLVNGYDPGTASVVILDPRRGQLVLPTVTFERSWAQSGHFSLLCVAPAQAPAPPT